VDIFKYDVYSGPNVGVYTKVNDDFVFLPKGFAKSKAENLSKYLNTDCLYTSIANTRLLGIMMVANNQGILLPKNSHEHEFEFIKRSTGLNVQVLNTKHTALGNMICVNDKGGVVSPLIDREDVKLIQDSLGIEVIQKKVAGYDQVGAMIVTTSQGGIIHPEVNENDLKTISNVLHVKLEPATINGGIPYVASGTLANNHSIVVGSFTSGPEIMMLTHAFTN
jgi:translation initiation factor 6